MQGRPGRFRSVTQFVEWRLRRTWRNRRGSAAWAAARSAVRSGTASCTIAAGVRAGDDVAEVRRHFLNAKHAGCRRLRRSRCAPPWIAISLDRSGSPLARRRAIPRRQVLQWLRASSYRPLASAIPATRSRARRRATDRLPLWLACLSQGNRAAPGFVPGPPLSVVRLRPPAHPSSMTQKAAVEQPK